MNIPTNLRAQLDFVRELDALKRVYRQTYLLDKSRKENDAEHSWHIAVMAWVMREHAPANVDLLRTIEMLLIHDVVEIDCGDTFCYDTEGMQGKHEREARAAERLFGLLPPELADSMRSLWHEFEARETPEARFANALDRLQPMLHNYYTGGGAWREHGVTADRVLRRNRIIADASPALWDFAREMVADAVRKSYLDPGPDYDRELARG